MPKFSLNHRQSASQAQYVKGHRYGNPVATGSIVWTRCVTSLFVSRRKRHAAQLRSVPSHKSIVWTAETQAQKNPLKAGFEEKLTSLISDED